MLNEEKKFEQPEEEQKIDNLDATLASPEAELKEEPSVSALDNDPQPTPEEKEEAGIDPSEPESEVEELNASATSSDEPVASDPIPNPAESENVTEVAPETTTPVPTPDVHEEVPEAHAAPEMPQAAPETHEELGVTSAPARTFTQEEVNDIAGKTRAETRNKTFQYIYDRYGVQDEAGLDELVGNAQRYDSLNEQYETDRKTWKDQSAARDKELADIKEQVALMQSGIDSERYEDAKLILRGKGLEVTLDNINAELATHPEWSKKTAPAVEEKPFEKVAEADASISTPNEPVTKLSVLGNEPSQATESEEERAMRLFRV